MKNLIVTFPLGARAKIPPLGLLTSPVLGDSLYRLLPNSEFYVLVNTLDSYTNRENLILPFKEALSKVAIHGKDQIWVDSQNLMQLYRTIKKLEKSKNLREEEVTTKRCDCGRIEMLFDVEPHPKARFYSIDKKKGLICKFCKSEAKPYIIKGLTMTYPNRIVLPEVFPPLMQKEVEFHINNIQNSKFLVSRSARNSPKYSLIGGLEHNLDVDFLWSNCLDGLRSEEDSYIYIIGSNHVSWHLCLIYSLFFTLNPKQNVKLVLSSYITNPGSLECIVNQGYQDRTTEFNRALILSSLSWKKQNSSWNKNLPHKRPNKPRVNIEKPTQLDFKTLEFFKSITDRQGISHYFKGSLRDSYLYSLYQTILEVN